MAKYIVPFLEGVRKEKQPYLEPFVGGANIVSQMSGNRTACDFNEYLIEMYRRVQCGYTLPDELSEEQYKHIKESKDDDKCLAGFVGFGCSFAGKWFGGYARNKTNHNYCKAAKNSLLKKMSKMQDFRFEWRDYKTLHPVGMLIYCDPPYKNTTKYTGVPDFNNDEFWDVMREWSKENDVYISEYQAPDDFLCVLDMPTKTNIRDATGEVCERVEKLFTIKKEKEKKEMELKIKEITFPDVIEFNFDELKQEISNRVEMYRNMVYSEEQVKQAKDDRAHLNKFVKALSDERIKVKKQCLQPYEAFEAKVKELERIVQEPIALIDEQVKGYEEKKKQEKLQKIKEFWSEQTQPTFLKFEQIYSPKWLNASVSMKSIQDEITARLEQITNDLITLENLPEFGFEAVEVYKTTLDVNKAINEAHRMSEIAKAKAAREAEQARLAAEAQQHPASRIGQAIESIERQAFENSINPPVEAVPAKQWISFKALLSVEDATALKRFFNAQGIQFEAI